MGRLSITIFALTRKAAGAITNCRFVGFDGLQATVQGQKVLGVADTDAAIGEDHTVNVSGTAIVQIGAVVAEGDELIADAQGRAIPSTGPLGVAAGATPVTSTAANGAVLTGGDGPEFVAADALEAGAAINDFIEVLLRR